jgi:hypothetical protein
MHERHVEHREGLNSIEIFAEGGLRFLDTGEMKGIGGFPFSRRAMEIIRILDIKRSIRSKNIIGSVVYDVFN